MNYLEFVFFSLLCYYFYDYFSSRKKCIKTNNCLFPSFVSVYDELPIPGCDVIALNDESWEVELGFRSELDTNPVDWHDFHFEVTHWSYVKLPK